MYLGKLRRHGDIEILLTFCHRRVLKVKIRLPSSVKQIHLGKQILHNWNMSVFINNFSSLPKYVLSENSIRQLHCKYHTYNLLLPGIKIKKIKSFIIIILSSKVDTIPDTILEPLFLCIFEMFINLCPKVKFQIIIQIPLSIIKSIMRKFTWFSQ